MLSGNGMIRFEESPPCFKFDLCLSNSLLTQQQIDNLNSIKDTLPFSFTICGHLADIVEI